MAADRAELLKNEIRFLRGAIARPLSVGAVAPSSRALARAIAAEVDPDRPGRILELGPGTGVVTEALLDRGVAPERITAIEWDEDFARLLAARFPRAHIINGDAFDLRTTLRNGNGAAFAGIVSGLPLLNHPPTRRADLVEGALARLAHGAPFVQFSYGFTAPIPPPPGASVEMAAFVWRNLPPARVWVYRHP